VAYSPNGQLVATGGDDGKVKVWNVATGFCFVTFSEHKGPITGLAFMGGRGTGHGLAVVSSSLDGTVRAFDLVRYRNFRTFTPATPVQFTSLAVDEGGEVVMAGGMDPFTIHVWSVQTGKVLDVLAGHDAPIASLSYCPAAGLLASASWDKTVRLWDVFRSGTATETLRHGSDALAVAFRPDGAQLAVSTLDGTIHFWDVKRGAEVGTIDGRRDAAGGRKAGDVRTAKSSAAGKCFTAIAYTADGECLLAGGRTKYACLYAVAPKLLLRKWQLTHNRSLEGVLDKLSGKQLGEAGHVALLDLEDAEDPASRKVPDASLPGATRGDMASKRSARPEARTKAVAFSPTGRAFALATTEGLQLFGLDEALVFDPFELGEDVTPAAAQEALADGQFVRALLLALHLNEGSLIDTVVAALPVGGLQLVMSFVPLPFLSRLLEGIAGKLHPTGAARSPHVEFYLRALLALLTAQARPLRERPTAFGGGLRGAQRALLAQREVLSRMVDGNGYTLAFLCDAFDTQGAAGVGAAASSASSSSSAAAWETRAAVDAVPGDEDEAGAAEPMGSADEAAALEMTGAAGAGAGGSVKKPRASAAKSAAKAAVAAAGTLAAADEEDEESDPRVRSLVAIDDGGAEAAGSSSSSSAAASSSASATATPAAAPTSGKRSAKASAAKRTATVAASGLTAGAGAVEEDAGVVADEADLAAAAAATAAVSASIATPAAPAVHKTPGGKGKAARRSSLAAGEAVSTSEAPAEVTKPAASNAKNTKSASKKKASAVAAADEVEEEQAAVPASAKAASAAPPASARKASRSTAKKGRKAAVDELE
jgi:hypothetical protein